MRQDGSVKFQGRMYFLSEALASETTGWVEVDEDIWQIWFGPVEVALYDAAERTLWPLGSAVSCDLSIGCSFGPGPGKLELTNNSEPGETE